MTQPVNRILDILNLIDEEEDYYLELYIPELTPEQIQANINECYQNLSDKCKAKPQ